MTEVHIPLNLYARERLPWSEVEYRLMEMQNWLSEHNINYTYGKVESSLVARYFIMDSEEAVLFRLRFGI